MKVAIIGSGNVGSAVARASKNTGHDVVATDVAAESLRALGEAIGVRTTASSSDAVKSADVVVLAVPFGE